MSVQYRILVVEDDDAIREGVMDVLENQGWEVISAANGKEGLALAVTQHYDLALLDVVLPLLSGWDILRAIGQERPGVPVILLTAKGEEDNRVKGLTLGADDYVVKPFSVRELLARIQAVLRRSPERPVIAPRIELRGGAHIDREEHVIVLSSAEKIALSQREFDLLLYLSTHPNRVISRDELLRRVWGIDPKSVETRTVEMTIARLRDKLGEEIGSDLQTQRGLGYIWRKDEQ